MSDISQFRALAKNWEAFGDADPLFGVLSDPAKFGGKWSVDEFFETGHAHIRKLMRILKELDVAFTPGACLDFGCGVGRLTIPLSQYFERTVGVDVARSMIEPARRHLRPEDRCEFVVNREPDLRQFRDATFDMVHSCLVLQHIPPSVTLGYIGEFLRVTRPGGLVVFQLPAATLTEAAISAAHALPDVGYAASLQISQLPPHVAPSARVTVQVAVTNASPVRWRHDIPAGRHITVANHWWHDDGSVAVADDGRARLTRNVEPGETINVSLDVQAPDRPGRYLLDVDLVQERVCWFAEKGSKTAGHSVTVEGSVAVVPSQPASDARPRPSLVQRLRRRVRGGTPAFEMHVVPRAAVESAIAASGATLLHAVDDNAAGERWISYTYICRRARA